MKLGFDVDGLFADFCRRYRSITVQVTGVDLFQPGDEIHPPCWNWPEFRGYTAEQMKLVWTAIKLDPYFWSSLPDLPCAKTLRLNRDRLESGDHDIYFITDRPGVQAKRQTEIWLRTNTGFTHPTVIISAKKGAVAAALSLDAYIDDKWEHALDVVAQSPTTRMYLFNTSYNLGYPTAELTRVTTVQQMLEMQGVL